MNLRIFVVVILFFIGNFCKGQDPFDLQINELQSDSLMKGATMGIVILNAGNDSTIFALNADVSLVPASVLKLVTSGAALEILGPDYTFKTRLATTGTIDRNTHYLNGDIVIIGGGDPTLGSIYFHDFYLNPPFLDRWITAITNLGIRGINGGIYVDESIYDGQTVPATWIWEDIGNYYGAGASGLTAYDNMFNLVFKSGKKAGNPVKLIEIDPRAKGLEFENHVISSDNKVDNAFVYGSPWGNHRIIRGTIPKGEDKFTVKAAMPEPGLVLGKQLKSEMLRKNIPVWGDVVRSPGGVKPVPFYTFESPPLSDIIKAMNHESINLFAEHLAKQIAYEKKGVGSTKEGVGIIRNFWEKKGIDTKGMFLEDGSGLSRFNAVSPRQLASVLLYMKNKSPDSSLFVKSLPLVGEGTMDVFNPKYFSNGVLRCKSGSMTRVRSYAGYLKSNSGQQLIFVLMANNFSMSQSEMIHRMEGLLVALKKEN